MNKQLEPLVSLRGIAALIVVIFHFAYYIVPQTGVALSAYSYLFKNGYLCVDLFFMLSGFIMTHVYLDRFSLGVNKSRYWIYLTSRFARIYPLHIFTLSTLVCLIIVKMWFNLPAFAGQFTFGSLIANIFLLQAFDFGCPPLFSCNTFWNEPAWSIGVEFIIYCIFPFILFALLKTKFKTDLVIYIVSLIATFLLIKFTRGTLSTIVGIPGVFRCGLECVVGIITYKVFRWNEQRQALNLNLLAFISLAWIAIIMHTWSDRFRGFHDWSILPAFSLLILSTADRDNGLISKLMSSQVLMYLGTISYSIYMVHWCLAELVKFFWLYKFNVAFGSSFDATQSLIALGLFIPVVLLVASLTYHWIEVPARKFLKPKPQFSG